jgi:queuosine precursor transporter
MNTGKLFAALAVAYVGLVVVANWLASKWVIGVPFTNLVAPAGFLAIGAVLVIRDWLQQLRGLGYAIPLMLVAGAASYAAGFVFGWTSLQTIAVASVVAFLVSETVEAVLFTPIRNRSLTAGVALSATVANAIDSALFIWLAWSAIKFPGATFHDLFLGNFVGKLEMIAVGVALTAGRRIFLPVPAAT